MVRLLEFDVRRAVEQGPDLERGDNEDEVTDQNRADAAEDGSVARPALVVKLDGLAHLVVAQDVT